MAEFGLNISLQKIEIFLNNLKIKIKLKTHKTVSLWGKSADSQKKNIGRGRIWHRKSLGNVPHRSPSLVDGTDCPPHFAVQLLEFLV